MSIMSQFLTAYTPINQIQVKAHAISAGINFAFLVDFLLIGDFQKTKNTS